MLCKIIKIYDSYLICKRKYPYCTPMRRCKIFIFGLMVPLFLSFSGPEGHGDTLRVMFWNVENLLNPFTSGAERRWTFGRFRKKCQDIAKTIFWCADAQGGLPDVIGLAEVEDRFVLGYLLKHTALEKAGYGIIHFDSRDHRGIDVALLYRKAALRPARARPVPIISEDGDTIDTRDILVVDFTLPGGSMVTFAVNHHPSKYRGAGKSAPLRRAAMRTLEAVALEPRDSAAVFIAMGDFNDTPGDTLFAAFQRNTGLINLAAPLARDGKGTIRYQGRWEMIDMFFVPPADGHSQAPEMQIQKPPFLMERDNVHSGEKPFRTYVGPRYAGGVSDHLPVFLVYYLKMY